MKVMVAMSGGVDSSVAAALLAEEGHEVIGATMRVFDYSKQDDFGSCCAPLDTRDAKRVCDALGLPHYTFNVEDRFREEVIKPFAAEYRRGRTPNPCVLCNDRMKFRWMLGRAKELECDALATGHYARIEHSGGRYSLLTAADHSKDQSYFLFTLTQEQLARVLFPVGELSKTRVRDIASRLGLRTAHKPESQEICFVAENDYARVVETWSDGPLDTSGELVDTNGHVIGLHDGYHKFTVGQRKGFGSFGTERRYVIRIEPETKRVVIGDSKEVFAKSLACRQFHWIAGEPPADGTRGKVRVRHRHAGAEATARFEGKTVRFEFDEPVRAVTPGQAAVFYEGDKVLGGGYIDGF